MIFARLAQLLSVALDLLSLLVRSDREKGLEIALLRQQIRLLGAITTAGELSNLTHVKASWPHRGVIRRAARWDGFVGGKVHADDEDWHLTSAEVATLRAEIARQRTATMPRDLALGGGARGPDLEHERALIRSMAEAGATWWMEYIYPELGGLDGMRTRIQGGPFASTNALRTSWGMRATAVRPRG